MYNYRRRRKRRNHARGKIYKRLRIGFWILFATVIVLGLGIFSALRFSGEKKIEKEINRPKQTEEGVEEDLVYSDGKTYRYLENSINILFMGIDKEGDMSQIKETGGMGQADAIFLLSMNLDSERIRMIAIPRETVVPVEVYDRNGLYKETRDEQIALQFAYGQDEKKSCELMADTVSHLCYQVPIHKYIAMNMGILPELNDVVGGVRIQADEQVKEMFPDAETGRFYRLHGEEAVTYLQSRDSSQFASSMDRLERQKQYILGFILAARLQMQDDTSLPLNLYEQFKGNYTTNLSADEFTYLAAQAAEMTFSERSLFVVPGEMVQDEVYEKYQVDDDGLFDTVLDVFYERVRGY